MNCRDMLSMIISPVSAFLGAWHSLAFFLQHVGDSFALTVDEEEVNITKHNATKLASAAK